MKSFLKKSFMSLLAGTALVSSSWAAAPAPNPVLPAISLTDELGALGKIAPKYQNKATDKFQIVSISPTGSTLDQALMGPATYLNGSVSAWAANPTTGVIFANALCAGAWKTFSVTLGASYGTSANIDAVETVSNGGAAGNWKIQIQLTAAASSAALTRAALANYLAASPTLAVPSTAGTIVSPVTLTTGWTVKLAGFNGAVATAINLEPEKATVLVPIFPLGAASPINFQADLANLHNWNIAPASATAMPMTLYQGPTNIGMNAFPGNFVRTSGIGASLLSYLSTNPQNRLFYSPTAPGFYNSLASGVNDVFEIFNPGASGSLKATLNAHLADETNGPLTSSAFVIGRFPTSADSDHFGLLAHTSASLANAVWSSKGTSVVCNASVGASGTLKDFVCDLTGVNKIQNDAPGAGVKRVLAFQAADEDAFFVVSVIGNGDPGALDATGITGVTSAADQATVLAILLRGALSAVTTIDNMSWTGPGGIIASAAH